MTAHDPAVLPADLPVPEDDGACDHLPGKPAPAMSLPATDLQSAEADFRSAKADGGHVDLSAPHPGRTVVYAYPRTGRPGTASPAGWDAIPGARGCTPESCGFRDHHAELGALGCRVFGLSTQTSEYQREAVERLRLPFPVLSDAGLAFSRALALPTFEVAGERLIKRLTLVIRDRRIEHVFYPVFPPDAHAAEVVDWLADNPL